MKKSKILVASIIMSCSLISISSNAGLTTKPPPVVEAQAEQSFSDWFLGLFDF